MYELFELVRLLSVRRQSTRQGPVELTRFAWRENGESSLLALLCSNDQLLVRWSVSGRPPVLRQLPWAPEKRVAAMCFDPTVSWLLVVTEAPCLYILPVLALMDPSARVNQLWSLTDCTVIPVAAQSTLCAACWWHTLDDRQVAVVATKVGELLFVDLLTQEVRAKVTTDIQVSELSLILDDDQMSTSLLMTGVSNGQWKMLLEARMVLPHFSPDSDLSDLGYIDIDHHHIPPQSVLDCSDESSTIFSTERIPQSQPWVILHPQYARGRHFITAHDQKSATLQVYDSEIQFSPLFIYKLPPGAESVILTDRLTFTLSRRNGSQLLILSNQRAETSVETLQDFNDDAVIQRLELPVGEKLMGACHRTFPFYWHDKQEEQQRLRLRQGTLLEQPSMETVAMDPQAFDIPVTTHTVLDGCIVVTDSAVYECRPRASPERLFLQHTMVSGEMGVAEHLAISVGLDITLLAELAAHHLLREGHVSRAIRLYALSKCPASKRCASLARYGRVQEMGLLLKQTLHNPALELSSKERKVLADMLLHCYVYMVAHQPLNVAHTVSAFRDFLLSSFAFEESVALDLLAEYGLANLLLDFAMARGLVADALGRLVAKDQLPVALTLLTQLVTRGFSAHVLQAAQGGVLSSLTGEAVIQVLVTNPQLATRHVALVKRHMTSLDLPLLLQLAALLDPSQGTVRSLVRRQSSSLHRAASLSSLASLVSNISDSADNNQDGMAHLSRVLEVFLLTVLHINHLRGDQQPLTADSLLADPTLLSQEEDGEEGTQDGGRKSLALSFALASCGSHHSAVVRDGDLYTWGRTLHGRLGHGDLVREGMVSGPACVQTFHMLQIRVESVACGGEHTLAITQQGVYGWGNSRYGQVGVGTRHVYHRPMLLETLLPHTCVSIYCGQYHSLAITSDCRLYWQAHTDSKHGIAAVQGEVWSFGCGYFGQLGIGDTHKKTTPVLISTISEPVAVIGTKYFHNVAVTVNNRVYTWGCHPHNLRYAANAMRRSRQAGQNPAPMGDGMDMFHLPAPVDTTFLRSQVVQVSCGSLHTCLLTQDGEIFVWGRNLEGQLGTGSRQDERVPKMLTRINDQHIIHLCSGGEFNLALDTDFSLWVWGKNDFGQLGLVRNQSGHKSSSSNISNISNQSVQWRQSHLVTSDVVVPTGHRGLPPVNLSGAPSRWAPSAVQGPSAAVQHVQWVDEGWDAADDALLPSLKSVCADDLPYHRKVIPVVVKCLGDLMDKTAILQHCVDLGDWFTAAQLCALDYRHVQALCYRLLGLRQAMTSLSAQKVAELSAQVVEHHLKLALKAAGNGGAAMGEHDMSTLCLQVTDYWLEQGLPVTQLQQLMYPHLPALAPHLVKLLFRCEAPTSAGTGAQFYCQHFSPWFCLRVLNVVLMDQSVASQQLLSSWLPQDVQKPSGEDKEDSTQERKSLHLQPQSRLIPYHRVWQDIVRTVSKSSSSTAAIQLTRSQLDHLHTNTLEGENNGSSTDDDAGSVVLFTCGHHFTQTTFTNIVLATSLQELGGGSHLSSSGKLPATASLLQQYYQRQGLMPLACPKCVLNVLRV